MDCLSGSEISCLRFIPKLFSHGFSTAASMTTSQRQPAFTALLIFCGLLLLIWFTRLPGIDRFPAFIDEMIHIYGSELGYKVSPLVNADIGRQGTIWWMMLFQAHLGDPVWVGRVATVLALMPGAAALMAVARLMAGHWAAVFAGVFFLLSNYHMFFGRLALADPIAGSAVLVAIYFAARLARRRSLTDAAMVGLLLAVGVVAKINVLPFLGVPIAAALCLHPREKINVRGQLMWLGVALGVAVGLIAAFVIVLRIFGYDFVTNSVSYALTNRGAASINNTVDLQRISGNMQAMLRLVSDYLGVGVVLLLIGSQVVLMARRQFFLPLCLIGPVLTLWASQIQESRFLVVPVALLLLGGAVVLARLVRGRGYVLQATAVAAVVVWGGIQWLPFTLAGMISPDKLPLPQVDTAQYLESDAAGTGYVDVDNFLDAYPVREVIGLVSNCQAFRYANFNRYRVDCPVLNPNGSNIPALRELVNQKQADGVFVLVQDIPYVPHDIPGQLLTVIQRPNGGPAISIYQLSSP